MLMAHTLRRICRLPAGDVKNPGAALISYAGNEPKDKEEAAKQLARVSSERLALLGCTCASLSVLMSCTARHR